MFFTEEKIKARIKELEPYRYREGINLTTWSFLVDADGLVGTYPPKQEVTNFVNIGDRWKGRDLYVWLSRSVTIPDSWSDKQIVGIFDFGKTGGGSSKGFESLLFLNDKPYQGVDSNHKEVFIPNKYSGQEIDFDFRLWSGLEGGGPPIEQEHQFKCATLAWLDEHVDDYYYNLKVMIETIEVLDETVSERHKMISIVNESLNKINWLYPGSDEFYASIYKARKYLNENFKKIKKHHDVTFHCVGHTHIDVAWLWQLEHTREKSARSFSTVLRLMELYPEYLFVQSQPQLYEYIKKDYPEIYTQIQERIKDGRWEIGGGMWLEADCNIPSGESLVRQLLFGTKFMREEFGVESDYLWLPDVFGYSWALPQILKKSGIDTFMTTKISWNQYNQIPHDTFKWRGIDGTEILTHFITTVEPESDSHYYTYNGSMSPKVVDQSWEAYKNKNINQDLLLAYGYGDGGGGVTRDMLEVRKRIDKMPGIPHAKPTRADTYFNQLHSTINESKEYIHTWDGELYLEYHRGTYTSQAFVKKMNRKLELLYRETEWLNILSGIEQHTFQHYPSQLLNDGWKIILRNQFHDIIPGSSIMEVYEDAYKEYMEALKIGEDIWSEAAKTIVNNESDNIWTVFNSALWERNDLVYISDIDYRVGMWHDHLGNTLKAQKVNEGWYVQVNNIPSMGYAHIQFVPHDEQVKEVASDIFKYSNQSMMTPFYSITWNEQGQLVSVYDLDEKREVIAENERGNVFQVFEDKPLNFDAWDIDIFYQEKMEEITELQSVRLIEQGDLQATVRFEWLYGQSKIYQDMIVYSHSRRIDFKTKINWQERQRLLKTAFPVDIRSTEATYDIQFGNVSRPTHWNTSWDQARFETVGHQWADLSEGGYGVSLLNESKYGYDIKDNVIRLSLLKSAIHPDPLADEGEHQFTYSLLPHDGTWKEGRTIEEAWELNNPLTHVFGTPTKDSVSFLSSSVNHVMVDAVKKAEEAKAVVVRIHEFEGKRGQVKLTSDFKIKHWQECDLMERPISEIVNDDELNFYIKPYEIKTFLVTFHT